MINLSSLSLQFVQADISATVAGNPLNPTVDTVQFAFTLNGANPVSGDWKTGSWDGTQPRSPSGVYVAQCLVGPGGAVTLTPATYTMWVKILDSPEVPVISVGLLNIT